MSEIIGLNNLLANVNTLKNSVVQVAGAVAVAQVTTEIADYAKATHPFTNRTGNLEASIHAKPVNVDGDIVTGYVQAGMEYAAHVEFGTSRAAPYPYMHPAIEANRENLRKTVGAAVVTAQKSILKVK